MFQDSVPAGSYNDPFLSSVCVCVYTAIHMQKTTTGHLMTMHVMFFRIHALKTMHVMFSEFMRQRLFNSRGLQGMS